MQNSQKSWLLLTIKMLLHAYHRLQFLVTSVGLQGYLVRSERYYFSNWSHTRTLFADIWQFFRYQYRYCNIVKNESWTYAAFKRYFCVYRHFSAKPQYQGYQVLWIDICSTLQFAFGHDRSRGSVTLVLVFWCTKLSSETTNSSPERAAARQTQTAERAHSITASPLKFLVDCFKLVNSHL